MYAFVVPDSYYRSTLIIALYKVSACFSLSDPFASYEKKSDYSQKYSAEHVQYYCSFLKFTVYF